MLMQFVDAQQLEAVTLSVYTDILHFVSFFEKGTPNDSNAVKHAALRSSILKRPSPSALQQCCTRQPSFFQPKMHVCLHADQTNFCCAHDTLCRRFEPERL